MSASEQGDWQTIRKDATELTIADFERFPAWSYCLDEEDEPDQDENTVKPAPASGPICLEDFSGHIIVDVRFKDGTKRVGTIVPNMVEFSPLAMDFELWLDGQAKELTSERLPEGWDSVIFAESMSLTFWLPKKSAYSDERVRESIRLAYDVLKTTCDQMWPITVTPRVQIQGWPASWQIDGWTRLRPDLTPGEVFK